MKCRIFGKGDVKAFVCGTPPRKKHCGCGDAADYLCDWKVRVGRTCDKPICSTHAKEVAPGKHLCPEHQLAYRDWLAAKSARPAAE